MTISLRYNNTSSSWQHAAMEEEKLDVHQGNSHADHLYRQVQKRNR